MFDIASADAFFLLRQHGTLKTWTEESEEGYVGKTETGSVYEQRIGVFHPKTEGAMVLRRIRLVLFEPTRDGETEIVLLTNLSKKSASAEIA